MSDRWRERVEVLVGEHQTSSWGFYTVLCPAEKGETCTCVRADRILAILALIEEVEREAETRGRLEALNIPHVYVSSNPVLEGYPCVYCLRTESNTIHEIGRTVEREALERARGAVRAEMSTRGIRAARDRVLRALAQSKEKTDGE